jgi:thioredoxin 1
MPTIDLTEATFPDALKSNDIVLVDWWADWCGPCKAFAPTYEKASEAHPDITFAKVDTEANQQLSAMAQITSIPTLMVFREQILLFSQAGALPPAQLEELIQATKNLNMDDVRKAMLEQQMDQQNVSDDI